MGNMKDTTFKTKVNDYVFSSLFNTGAQVSCIKHDTVAALGLLHQISESSTCIRTANGQDYGVKGSIMINFKIGPCSFMHKFVVCSGITRPFILGEEFLSHHCFRLGWTDDIKRFAKYRSEIYSSGFTSGDGRQNCGISPCKNSSKALCHGANKVPQCFQVG